MYPHPRIVALLLALMVHRQKKARARISEKTLRSVSRRSTIRGSFLSDLGGELEDIGYVLVSLARGGYALIAISALEGAPSLLARDHIAEELRSLRNGTLDEAALWRELGYDDQDEEE